MNQSNLDCLFENVYEAIDNLNIVHRTDYERARQDIRDKKYDHMLLDVISNDEKAQLDELERIGRLRHKNYCDAIINVRDLIREVTNALDKNDDKDIDRERLNELQVILNELPECPPESHFLNITDIEDDSLNNCDDDDDESILSEIDDDLDMNEEPIDDNDARNESQIKKIIEKSKEMRRIEAELEELEEMKNQSKTEMFAAKDQQLDITGHQQHQRDLFHKLNELKINYREVKAEVKGMIQEVFPYLNDDTIGKELMELYYRLERDDAIEKVQAPKMQSKIPQAPSRIPFQVPQVAQTSSRVPRLQFTSNIPQTTINRPQTASRIPQMPTRLPQMSTNRPQTPTRIPQTFIKQPVSHRSIAQQTQIHSVQQPSQLPRTQTKIPQGPISQIPRQMSTSRIPRTTSQLQMDVEQHKNKLGMTSNVRQLGNIQQRIIPQRISQDRNKQLGANLKISESIGNVRKVRVRPTSEPASKTSRPNLRHGGTTRLQLRNLTAAQQKNIDKQNKIKTEDVAARMLRDAEKALSKLTKGSKFSIQDREIKEKEDIEMLISSALRLFFNELENVNLSHEHKIKGLEEKLKKFFGEVRRIMTQYRGKSFVPDEAAIQRFIDNVLNHFNEKQNFENYREILAEFFKKLPQKKFQIQKQQPQVMQQKQMLHSTPQTTRRPLSARRYNDVSRIVPPSQRPSSDAATKQTKAKVQNQVRKLEKTSLQSPTTQAAIKQKLDKFVDTFCKIFILNQKNRRNKFEIWVKTFRTNLNPILNDLEAFYKTLPYPEIQNFNREQIEKSLDRLLLQVYEQTRKYDLTNIKCKDLIGNEMKKLMEQKHLKNLKSSLSVFLQGIKELIEPYIQPSEELPSIIQKPQKTTQNRGQQSMLQKLHESNIQRALHRTLMNETDDSVEYPSFNESLLQQVSLPELQSMYRKMLKGKYQIPNVQGTAQQAMMLEKIENLIRKKAERGMGKQRDESFLRGHGKQNQSFQFPIHERLAPSSINTFKRIIGSNEILDAVEITDEMLKVLDIVLECCETVDENICKVLINQTRNEASALDDSLNILVAHIKNLIYNNNVIDYGDELARLDKLHYKVDVDELKTKLGRKVFTKADCENLLENAFLMQVNESDVAVYAVIEFVKNLRYMEYKYMLKILKGEIRGEIDKTPITAESSREDLLSTTPSTSYLDKIKFVQPIRVVKDYNYPHDLIERDILYVACQLTNRNEIVTAKDDANNVDDDDGNDIDDDRNGHMDYLSRFIIQIAQKYQNGSINERDALRIIGQIFYMLPCIPINFYQRFIYHADNEYFSSIRFHNTSLNTAARIETMELKNRTMCAEDKLLYGRQVTLITDQIERFMFVFDNEIEEIARSFQLLDTRKANGIKICGNELSNNGNGILGNPKAIDTKNAVDGKIDNVQLSLVSSQPPVTNIVNEDMENKLKEIDAILDKHLGEVDHFENSKVAKVSLKYELQPNAIKRKNYWQCRGSEIPKWFPGFYSVFPNTNASKPIAYSIEQILPHAWRMMAPINYK